MSKEECEKCKFFHKYDIPEFNLMFAFGACRRFPPVRDVQDMYDKAADSDFKKEAKKKKKFSPCDEVGRWAQPVTYGNEWCGEFKPKTQDGHTSTINVEPDAEA